MVPHLLTTAQILSDERLQVGHSTFCLPGAEDHFPQHFPLSGSITGGLADWCLQQHHGIIEELSAAHGQPARASPAGDACNLHQG